jgi:hypothetical protein
MNPIGRLLAVTAHHFGGARPSLEPEGVRGIPRRAKRSAAWRDKRKRPAEPVARRASGASTTAFRSTGAEPRQRGGSSAGACRRTDTRRSYGLTPSN